MDVCINRKCLQATDILDNIYKKSIILKRTATFSRSASSSCIKLIKATMVFKNALLLLKKVFAQLKLKTTQTCFQKHIGQYTLFCNEILLYY